MIRNYIFDLVGVIADFGTKRIFQHFIEMGAADVWELNNEMDLGRQPDLRAYQNVLDSAGLRASETLFLDDSPANVQAAESLGIHGLLVLPAFPNSQLLSLS